MVRINYWEAKILSLKYSQQGEECGKECIALETNPLHIHPLTYAPWEGTFPSALHIVCQIFTPTKLWCCLGEGGVEIRILWAKISSV